jgi:hypothetical protein
MPYTALRNKFASVCEAELHVVGQEVELDELLIMRVLCVSPKLCPISCDAIAATYPGRKSSDAWTMPTESSEQVVFTQASPTLPEAKSALVNNCETSMARPKRVSSCDLYLFSAKNEKVRSSALASTSDPLLDATDVPKETLKRVNQGFSEVLITVASL